MGHFHALPDAVAVAADRLVAVVRVGSDGGVVVRDLANGGLSTISASELRAPPTSSDPTVLSVASLVHATDAQWELVRRRKAVIAALVDTSDLADKVTRASAGLGISAHRVPMACCLPRRTADVVTAGTSARHPRGRTPHRRASRTFDRRSHPRRVLTKVRAKKEEVVRQVGVRCASERIAPPSRKAIFKLPAEQEIDPALA